MLRSVEDTGNRIYNDVICDIEKRMPRGPHQQAAIDAFHATVNGTRPLSRSGGGALEDDMRSVENTG